MRLLIIIPYAPNLIRVRPYQIIRALHRQGHEITLATLWTDDEERRDLAELEALGISVIAERLTKARSLWNVARTVPSTRPLQTDFCWHPTLAQRLVPPIIQQKFDAIHVEHLRGALYGLHVKRTMSSSGMQLDEQVPVIWDSVDCISHLFSQAASQSRSLKGRLMTRLDLKRTQRFEGFLVNQFEHVVTTSTADANALAQLAVAGSQGDYGAGDLVVTDGQIDSGGVAKISAIPNGVDLDYFQPRNSSKALSDSESGAKTPSADSERPTVVFSGKMSYHANVTAALYLVEEIMPRVWAERPDVQVQLVGKDPAPEVRALAEASIVEHEDDEEHSQRVIVTGTVPDLRPYLTGATVAAAPVPYGAGIQNKVLEAMACGAPVIASAQAASGVAAQSGSDLLVAEDAESFGNAILGLIADSDQRQVLSAAGRHYVETHHSWSRVADELAQIYSTYSKSS